jgi:hypothetical protein
MSCEDDLTAVDLHSGVAVEVLERVSAVSRARERGSEAFTETGSFVQGEGRDENLYGFIDHHKSVSVGILRTMRVD